MDVDLTSHSPGGSQRQVQGWIRGATGNENGNNQKQNNKNKQRQERKEKNNKKKQRQQLRQTTSPWLYFSVHLEIVILSAGSFIK